uniref:Uncharacterized protein LOC8267370 n=1 Tax=Rhizophora mucronata TaxID=61149 RepID=A0A2P2JNZ0_RHIMU
MWRLVLHSNPNPLNVSSLNLLSLLFSR